MVKYKLFLNEQDIYINFSLNQLYYEIIVIFQFNINLAYFIKTKLFKFDKNFISYNSSWFCGKNGRNLSSVFNKTNDTITGLKILYELISSLFT